MIDIIDYIRNLFFPSNVNRKKRRSTYEEPNIPIKIRRTLMSQPTRLEDDWYSSSSSSGSIKRRSGAYPISSRTPISKSKENIIYNLDDDDVLEVQPKGKFKSSPICTTSTPNNRRSSLLNGDDDVAIISCTESTSNKKENYQRQGLDYISKSTCLRESQNTFRQPSLVSKMNRFSTDQGSSMFNSIQDIRAKLNQRSSTLDQSFRLDEKLKYRELLSQAAPYYSSSNDNGSFSKYLTPCGKLFHDPKSSRGKKLVDLARKSENKGTVYIDLTEKKTKPKISTKDMIKKVLNDLDNEPIIVKDSDSEVEILPSPPSPKPDVKVERVNSLKKVVDTTEPSHNEWLQEVVQKYINTLAKNEKEIKEQTIQKQKMSEINNQIRLKWLEDDVKRCLQIKELVLPTELPEESSLPALTEEQETLVAKAINPRGNPNEVLVQKFSLSITRRDIMTLSGLNWLNDEVINFYMNLIIERGKLPKWPKAYAMNTFFYPKLLKDGPASLRRWTRKVDIFAHDIITVPIHLGVHWCMSVIDFRQKTIKYYDSMGGSNKRCLDALLRYLQAEHLDKKKTEYDVSKWEVENVKDIPQQMNGSDCGMFSCTFAEFLTRDAKITFSQEDMPYLRRKMVFEIISGNLLIT